MAFQRAIVLADIVASSLSAVLQPGTESRRPGGSWVNQEGHVTNASETTGIIERLPHSCPLELGLLAGCLLKPLQKTRYGLG